MVWDLFAGKALLQGAVEVPMPARYKAPVLRERQLRQVARVPMVHTDVRSEVVVEVVVEVRAPWR